MGHEADTTAMDEPEDQAPEQALGVRLASEMTRLTAERLASGLYLVATPIGNLADISLRALAVLARCDVVYCEDTRHSRTLVAHFGLRARLKPYHEHNAEEQRPRILADLAHGGRVGLISDAGTPLISDPGYKLVRDCIAGGHAVVAIPGASAVMAGLCVAGLPTDRFLFAGFLPPRDAARRSRIAELAKIPATLILFEAPTRLGEALTDLAEGLGPRPAAVARELTKLHEDVRRGTLTELAADLTATPVKGEIVILVGPPGATETTDDTLTAALAGAMETMSLRDAAKAVAEAHGVSKARVYDLGLKAKGEVRS